MILDRSYSCLEYNHSITFTILSFSGNIPVRKGILIIRHNVKIIKSGIIFSRFGDYSKMVNQKVKNEIRDFIFVFHVFCLRID